jgi:hypothetical protein
MCFLFCVSLRLSYTASSSHGTVQNRDRKRVQRPCLAPFQQGPIFMIRELKYRYLVHTFRHRSRHIRWRTSPSANQRLPSRLQLLIVGLVSGLVPHLPICKSHQISIFQIILPLCSQQSICIALTIFLTEMTLLLISSGLFSHAIDVSSSRTRLCNKMLGTDMNNAGGTGSGSYDVGTC